MFSRFSLVSSEGVVRLPVKGGVERVACPIPAAVANFDTAGLASVVGELKNYHNSRCALRGLPLLILVMS